MFSTDEQAQRGHSIGEQERLIGEFAAERCWDLIDVFSDPGYSGAREDRPGLQELLSRLDDLDVVVVWAMDRLTRDVELFAKLAKRLTPPRCWSSRSPPTWTYACRWNRALRARSSVLLP